MNRFSRHKKIIIIFFYFSFFLLCYSFGANANTFYVDGSVENDSGDGSSWTTAKKYISSGVSLLSNGDTLIIADGTYTGAFNRISNPPSGTVGNYTTIRAETDFGVTLDGVAPVSKYGGVVFMKQREYVTVRGIKVYNVEPAQEDGPGSPFLIEACNHIRLIRCASDGQAPSTSTNGNVGGAFYFTDTTYSLAEECFAFGPGRYPFAVGDGTTGSEQGANYNIFRRCIQRWDWSDNYEVQASFAFYAQKHCAAQNCIAIDGKDIKGPRTGNYNGIKAFFTPNGSEGDIHFDGCIVLNYEGAGYWIEDGPINTTYITNSIAWDVKADGDNETYTPYLVACRYDSKGGEGPFAIQNCTLGKSDAGFGIEFDLHGAALDSASIKNTIVTNIILASEGYAVAGNPTHYGYNNYYHNTGNRNKYNGIGVGSISIAPESNGFLYLPRIESNSVLKTAGEKDGQIGAQIMYRIGRDDDGDGICGLLWGEEGWNELQDGSGDSNVRPLWPFPNEDVMKQDMAAYYLVEGEAFENSPEIIGARGFATGTSIDGSPQTLTKYIWEYLGNEIPSDIYGDGSDTLEPPSNIRVRVP